MNGLIAGGGLGLLLALAATIGITADRDARSSAWRRIASARRVNHEEAARLQEWEFELHVREHAVDTREQQLRRRDRELGTGETS